MTVDFRKLVDAHGWLAVLGIVGGVIVLGMGWAFITGSGGAIAALFRDWAVGVVLFILTVVMLTCSPVKRWLSLDEFVDLLRMFMRMLNAILWPSRAAQEGEEVFEAPPGTDALFAVALGLCALAVRNGLVLLAVVFMVDGVFGQLHPQGG